MASAPATKTFVYYYPAAHETGIHPDDPEAPCIAIVCHVVEPQDDGPTLVNLAAFDYRGMPHAHQDVPLVSVGRNKEPPTRPYCTVEPYVKKAKKA